MNLLVLNWKDPQHHDAGGAERYVNVVARIWSASGHNVTMFTPRPRGRAARDEIDGIRYIRQGTRATTFHWARHHLRQQGADYDHVLESVSTRPYLAHRIVGARATAFYHQIADDVWPQEFSRPVAWVGRRVVEPAWLRGMRGAKVVANSPSTVADLARFGVAVVGVVPPGCDLPTVPFVDRQLPPVPQILFIGRLVRTKRPDHAVAAFRMIAAAFPGAVLNVVGEGYYAETLAREAQGGIVLHGAVSDAEKSALLDAASLVLLPGTREGFGMVALEAAAHGVPVVAYDIPGLRDAVVHGVTGLLTEPAPAAMAEAAIQLLDDRDRWSALRRSARARAARFTWAATADSLMALMHGADSPPVVRGAA